MKNWCFGLIAVLFLSSCGVDKSADRMADSTETLNKYVEQLEKHVSNMDKAFLILLEEFRALNGNVEVLKEISPLIEKFDEFLEEDDEINPPSEEDFYDFDDIEQPGKDLTALQKLKDLEVQIESLNLNNPKEAKAYKSINKTLEVTVKSIQETLNQLKK